LKHSWLETSVGTENFDVKDIPWLVPITMEMKDKLAVIVFVVPNSH